MHSRPQLRKRSSGLGESGTVIQEALKKVSQLTSVAECEVALTDVVNVESNSTSEMDAGDFRQGGSRNRPSSRFYQYYVAPWCAGGSDKQITSLNVHGAGLEGDRVDRYRTNHGNIGPVNIHAGITNGLRLDDK